eukprot:TRINITY_DN9899_c0_g1_i1.p1 TRINITY_DN9899_c0_g1~~TRINITY_DN9899_c0_g1_i1.p1  ORF type:complete len:515 (-),score=73.71 TRINITY_DN9899_c0_g1_i1:106-1650(-)
MDVSSESNFLALLVALRDEHFREIARLQQSQHRASKTLTPHVSEAARSLSCWPADNSSDGSSDQRQRRDSVSRKVEVIRQTTLSIDEVTCPRVSAINMMKQKLTNIGCIVDAIVSAVVVLNVCFMGIRADNGRHWDGWFAFEYVFLSVYSGEVLIKLFLRGFRNMYWTGGDWLWNIFDLLVLALAVIDVIATATDVISFTAFRVLRICRLTRLVRILRTPFFKEILMMVNGIAASMRTLFWALILLSVPFYGIGLIVRETLGNDADDQVLQRSFGSVATSWFTVFRCGIGDCNDANGRPLAVLITQSHGWAYGLGYSLLMFLSVFGLFNVIAAIFVENVMDGAKSNEALTLNRRLRDARRTSECMAALLKAILDCYSRITGTEPLDTCEDVNLESVARIEIGADTFARIVEDPTIVAILEKLDIAEEDRRELFDILDADGSETLTMDEILVGFMKMRGQARRGDVVKCSLILRDVQRKLNKMNSAYLDIKTLATFNAQSLAPTTCESPLLSTSL